MKTLINWFKNTFYKKKKTFVGKLECTLLVGNVFGIYGLPGIYNVHRVENSTSFWYVVEGIGNDQPISSDELQRQLKTGNFVPVSKNVLDF